MRIIRHLVPVVAVIVLAACGKEERSDEPAGPRTVTQGSARPQLDKGTFAIFMVEVSDAYPTAWAWRPQPVAGKPDRELWFLYKPNLPGGYRLPGQGLPTANLRITWEDVHHGDPDDPGPFRTWVIEQYETRFTKTVTPGELELHDYVRK
jgi:hypothetical protein